MERFVGLADLYAQRSLNHVAFSALPDAAVQPYVESRHRIRRTFAIAGEMIRRPARHITQMGYSAHE